MCLGYRAAHPIEPGHWGGHSDAGPPWIDAISPARQTPSRGTAPCSALSRAILSQWSFHSCSVLAATLHSRRFSRRRPACPRRRRKLCARKTPARTPVGSAAVGQAYSLYALELGPRIPVVAGPRAPSTRVCVARYVHSRSKLDSNTANVLFQHVCSTLSRVWKQSISRHLHG